MTTGTSSTPRSGQSRAGRHTSIIYFHGMGTPKRYEELSRVLDTLDRYVEGQADEGLGTLRGQSVGLEPSRCGPDEPVAFLKFSRFVQRSGSPYGVGRFRLYESYWSPAAAGRVSSFAVLLWVFVRTLHPFTVLTSPWRAHQRLKTTFINRLFHDRGRIPARRYSQLAAAYRKFEGMDARRAYPDGRFASFLVFLRGLYATDTQAQADLEGLARRWRRSLVSSQVAVLAFGATIVAGATGVGTVATYLGAVLLTDAGVAPTWIGTLAARAGAVPAWINAIVGGLVVLVALGARRFLELFLADVVFWTTTFEKDVRYRKRREILKAAEDTVCHVLRDPACERIVILGHSLGTAIAYDTLLNLGRRWKADLDSGSAGPSPYEGLSKISHFISIGSPIDRINYFFHLTFSRYHRFNRVADTLLGRASDLPFQNDRQRVIQWINVRDRADPIASRLFSPRGALPNRDHIQEVEVANGHFPDPVGAHTGYFNSALAARLLFDACVLGRQSLQLHQTRPRWSKQLAAFLQVAVAWAAAALAWVALLGAIGYWIASPMMMMAAQASGVGLVAILALSAIVGRGLDRFHSLRLTS